MTDQQWKRALELYETAADLPESAAQALLESSTEETAVLQKVNKLLQAPAALDAAFVFRSKSRFTGCAIGRYEVIGLLGQGSTGEVYAGRDRELGRPVALKIMSAEYATLDSSSQRFLREAQASSALNHPNIVTVHEVITWNSSPVIVMELVEGKPLRALCGQPLALKVANRIGRQIMQALAFAHVNGIVHRDLKPENVIVRPDGYLKVLDFGLARRTFLQTGAGEVSSTAGLPIGTLRYMSPEQCRGESATPASDVFAAGIVLYELIAGQHPFHADSPLDTAHAIVWLQPRPLRQVNPEIAEELGDLILRMLAKDPGDRPSSQEVAKALTSSEDHSALKPAKRRSTYWLYAALTAVLLVAVATFWPQKWSIGTQSAANGQEADLRIAPLASLLGLERMPDVSPDGTRVAFEFSVENSPVSHIYVKDLTTSQLTRLTNDIFSDFQPVFSPDGKRLAFLRRQNARLQVMLMPSEGGIERQVGDISDTRISLRLITWDGKGTNLIVSEGLPGRTEPQMALFAISVESGAKQQITFPKLSEIDCMPVVSPDGRSLGFARVDGGGTGRLWATPLAAALTGGGENQKQALTDSDELIACWNWAADGRYLLIARLLGGKTNLWRYPVTSRLGGSPPVRVEGIDDQVTQTSVSRLTNRFIYTGQVMQNIGIWSYPLIGAAAAPKRLIASAKMDVDPRYSPDGKNIAFASLRGGYGQTDLWMSASDGSNQRQISSFGGQDLYLTGSPSWSPDGRWIAFDAGPSHPSSIYVLDVLGGKPRQITDSLFWSAVPSWSSDGRWIYFCSTRDGLHNIWKVSRDGGASVQLTHKGGFESFESPDKRFLYYTKFGSSDTGIYRMPLPDGKEEPVAGLEAVTQRYWEGSAKGIYFMAYSKAPVLEFFKFSNRQVSRIREMPVTPARTYRGLSVAPDGRSTLYVQAEPGRSNVMVVSNFH